MSVFDAYAAYYDLLYQDKDYAGEAAYVHGLLQRFAPGSRTILELGCGTGAHAVALSNYGYEITGIDLSPEMVARAEDRASLHRTSSRGVDTSSLKFTQGDLRDHRVDRIFDVVLALFHVVSYQTTNDDLCAAMDTAAAHLAPGGLFIFDCWYGPGVLTDQPSVRLQRLQSDGINITRIAEPVLFPNEDRVDVHYEVLVDAPSGFERIHETHSMRYLFVPGVDLLLEAAGMSRVASEVWLTGEPPSKDTWNVCFVARK